MLLTSVEGGSRLRGALGQGEFVEEEIVPNNLEGGEQNCTLDEGLEMIKSFAQSTKKIEDELTIRDIMAEVTKSIGHCLRLPTVATDAEIPCMNMRN